MIYRGAKFYPVQVEKVVRSFAELSDEFRIELSREERVGTDRCIVVAERVPDVEADEASLLERLRRGLREELLVTPENRLEPFGTLERTTFKARRIVDLRPHE